VEACFGAIDGSSNQGRRLDLSILERGSNAAQAKHVPFNESSRRDIGRVEGQADEIRSVAKLNF
jgi:hypothetical protein